MAEAKEPPIATHHPLIKSCLPNRRTTRAVLQPILEFTQVLTSNDEFEDWSLDIYEWLSLVGMQSPRVLREDSINPFLSRYQVPEHDSANCLDMVSLKWTGFIPALWIRALFIELR